MDVAINLCGAVPVIFPFDLFAGVFGCASFPFLSFLVLARLTLGVRFEAVRHGRVAFDEADIEAGGVPDWIGSVLELLNCLLRAFELRKYILAGL